MASNDLTTNDEKETKKMKEKVHIKRDNNFEDNWRNPSDGNQLRYRNQ